MAQTKPRLSRSGWIVSAIRGDPVRGTGVLANPLYRGHLVWNRVQWVRSAADSSKGRCVPNPPSEWVTREDERLRIVPQVLWDRVQARLEECSITIGAKPKPGVKREREDRRRWYDPMERIAGRHALGQREGVIERHRARLAVCAADSRFS